MLLALAQLGMAGYGAYQKDKAFGDQLSALNKLKQRSPEEMRYFNQMNQRASRGSINTSKEMSRRMPNIQASQQATQQSQQAGLYGSGLENSVIADELKRKSGRETLQQIASESQQLATANQATKDAAVKESADYGRRRTELLNNINAQQDGIRSQRNSSRNSAMIGAGIGLAGGIGSMSAEGGTFADGIKGMAFGGTTGGINYSGMGQAPSISQAGGPTWQSALKQAQSNGAIDLNGGVYYYTDANGNTYPVDPKTFFGGK